MSMRKVPENWSKVGDDKFKYQGSNDYITVQLNKLSNGDFEIVIKANEIVNSESHKSSKNEVKEIMRDYMHNINNSRCPLVSASNTIIYN